jgi:hypothetical protein
MVDFADMAEEFQAQTMLQLMRASVTQKAMNVKTVEVQFQHNVEQLVV